MSRFVAMLGLAAGLFLSPAAMANPVGFQHLQTTLGEELLGDVHCQTEPCSLTTRQFDITNQTGTAWTDYHIRIVPAQEDQSPPVIQSLTLLFPNGSTVIGGDFVHGDLFFPNNPLAPGGVLVFVLAVTEADQSVELFNVYGQPSVPEPASLMLLGGGLLGLAAARRRRAA